MFKKLLSNLPFNPSLITQVSFYAKRLKRESSIRKAGFVFVSLTLAMQAFAVISPAQASNKCSSNDVIRCGFTSKSQAVQQCNSNSQGFRSLIEYYGVNCEKIATSSVQTIGSGDHRGQLVSMGRNPYSKPGEYPVNIPGAGKFYLRPLSSWGQASHKMLVTATPDNQPFMIMFSCGNIVIKSGYTPPAKPAPPAKLKLAKVNKPTGLVKPGDTIEYTLAFSNTGGNAAFFSVNDILPKGLSYVSSSYGKWIFEKKGQHLKWYNNTPPYYTFGNTDAFGTPGFIKVKVKVDSNATNGLVLCNNAWVEDVNVQTKKIQKWSNQKVCNTVHVPTKPKPEEKPKPKPEEKPEEKSPILGIEKKAKNITQNIDDANGTTAAPGDVIEYTLITTNVGDGDSKDTILKSEELADVLEYSTLDLNSLDGAIFDNDTETIAWNKPVTIKPGQSVNKVFRVTIKNPLPQTPTPTGNPGSFDLTLTNVYGNTININLPGSVAKSTEVVTQTIPNTGPGESLAIGVTLTVMVGYFFARSRLLSKELSLVKQEYTSGN